MGGRPSSLSLPISDCLLCVLGGLPGNSRVVSTQSPTRCTLARFCALVSLQG